MRMIQKAKSYFILAKIHEYKALFEDAKVAYLKAIKIAENLEPGDGFFDPEPLYANLGELYAGDGMVPNAIVYYEKALTTTKNNAEHGVAAATYMNTLGDLYNIRMQTAKACENWNGAKDEYSFIGKQPPMSVLQLSTSSNCQKVG